MGEEFVKKIKPIGCVFFFGLLVVFLAFAFTSGRAPIRDYAPPQGSEYYAAHPDELQVELETNVFPHVEGFVCSEVSGDVLRIVLEKAHFAAARADILYYYDKTLFEFVME